MNTKLIDIDTRLLACVDRGTLLNQWRVLLKRKPFEFLNLSLARDKFTSRGELWKLAHEWNEGVEVWLHSPFLKLSAQAMGEQVTTFFKQFHALSKDRIKKKNRSNGLPAEQGPLMSLLSCLIISCNL